MYDHLAGSVTFNDVAMNFTTEEWTLLNPSLKKLYTDMMGKTFRNFATVEAAVWV